MLLAATIAVPQASAQAAARPKASAVAAASFLSVLQNSWTGKCADLPNYGSVPPSTRVTQFDCDYSITGDNQVWNFIPTTTYQGLQEFKVVNGKSGLCLDLPNYGDNPSGTPVSVYTCAANQDTDNQQWAFVPETVYGQEYYELVNKASGKCLDVANWAADDSDLASGLPLSIYECWDPSWGGAGYDDHLWTAPGYNP